jgi:hypothetical protein
MEYLSLIFDHFKSDILSTRSSTPFLVRFFDLFQQTLYESSSTCWSTTYERPLIPILENDIELLLNEDTSNSAVKTSSIETTEKKVTRRVSKALTNKSRTKRLEATQRLSSASSTQSQLSTSSSSSSTLLSSTSTYQHQYQQQQQQQQQHQQQQPQSQQQSQHHHHQQQQQQQSHPSLPNSDFINRVWSCVCARHEQRLRAEIEKTLFKANPKRDEVARLAEQRGFAEFHLIKHDLSKNDAHETDLMYKRLLQLINVFSRALPKMPQTYIARTVLDPRHQSLIIVFASKVIGGICFRMFPHR